METLAENTNLSEEFLSFLELYRLDNYSEALHSALYYLAVDGEANAEKQQIYQALHTIRHYINKLEMQYLPKETGIQKNGLHPENKKA